MKVVYTEGIEPSFIVFKTIVLTISRSNTFNRHPFVGVAGLEPATYRVSDDCSKPTELYSNFVVPVGYDPTPSAM